MMYPVYGWTSNHSQRGRNFHHPYHTPNFKPLPYHTNPDCYSYPINCRNCCNHNYSCYPSPYGFVYPHFPSRVPPHCHGSFPAFSGAYPVQHRTTPFYAAEQPWYEYDRNAPSDYYHLCGCPNHSCRSVPENSLNFQEQKSDLENQKSFPWLENYPHPFVWIPPGYLDPEKTKPTVSELKEEDKGNHEFHADESDLKSLDLKNLQSRGERNGQSPETRKSSRVHFPIFWLPSEGDDVLNEQGQILTSRFHDNEKNRSKSGAGNERKDDASTPVKQVEEEEDEKKTVKKTVRYVPVAKPDRTSESKLSEGGEREQSSLKKSSKVPPVCLRVDPLPKVKNSNVSSRSPSPATDNGRSSEDLSKKNLNSSQQEKQSQSRLMKNFSDFSDGKRKTKTIEVVDALSECENNDVLIISNKTRTRGHSSQFVGSLEKSEIVEKGLSYAKDEDLAKMVETQEACSEGQSNNSKHKETEFLEDIEKSDSKRWLSESMSESKAAVKIQSAYRGFKVKKSFKKLRQLAKISEEVDKVKCRVRELKFSDEKQRTVMGEIIMSLLLKLDAIQGLHPSVREVRKHLAKELVILQEKLDSLTVMALDTSSQQVEDPISTDTCMDDPMKPEIEAHSEPKDNQNYGEDTKFSERRGRGLIRRGVLSDQPSTGLYLNNESGSEGSTEKNEGTMNGVLPNPEVIPGDLQEIEVGLSVNRSEEVAGVGEQTEREELDEVLQLPNDEVREADCREEGIKVPINGNYKSGVEAEMAIDKAGKGLTSSETDTIVLLADEVNDTAGNETPSWETDTIVLPADKAKPIDVNESSVLKSETNVLEECDLMNEEAMAENDVGAKQPGKEIQEMVPGVRSEAKLVDENETLTLNDESIVSEQSDGTAMVGDDVGAKQTEEEVQPSIEGDGKLIHENENIRDMMAMLVEAGHVQLAAITKLTGRVKDLEKKLARKRKFKMRKSHPSSSASSNLNCVAVC